MNVLRMVADSFNKPQNLKYKRSPRATASPPTRHSVSGAIRYGLRSRGCGTALSDRRLVAETVGHLPDMECLSPQKSARLAKAGLQRDRALANPEVLCALRILLRLARAGEYFPGKSTLADHRGHKANEANNLPRKSALHIIHPCDEWSEFASSSENRCLPEENPSLASLAYVELPFFGSVHAAAAFTIKPLHHGERGEVGLAVTADVAIRAHSRPATELAVLHGLRRLVAALSDRRLVAETSASGSAPACRRLFADTSLLITPTLAFSLKRLAFSASTSPGRMDKLSFDDPIFSPPNGKPLRSIECIPISPCSREGAETLLHLLAAHQHPADEQPGQTQSAPGGHPKPGYTRQPFRGGVGKSQRPAPPL